MLDAATKARIDSARDILVGKVPDPKSQVEQITIALIYKFMDDMDRQSEELGGKASFFSDGFKKYAWHKLIDPRLSGHERLTIYAEGLEKMNENKHIPQLFRDIFKGAFLPYRDPETLNLFLKQINEFSYDHSERLGDAFEYLLSVLGSQGDAGQFRTPRHIIDFIVSIVDPKKNETVLDPACGTAGFLISAYKHILAANSKEGHGDLLTGDERSRLMNNFCGYDISPDMVRLSRANLYLHGFPQPRIHEYDTLTSEERWDERYDVIMANPPFMTPKGGIRPHNRFSVKSTRSEVLFVDYIAEHLNVNGRAGVIVPEGVMFQSGNAYKTLRRMLVENYLWSVVSLPAGVFNPYSGVKTCVLLMDKALVKRTDEILFAKIENDGFGLGAQRRPITENDLPEALRVIRAWYSQPELSDTPIAHSVSRKRILESTDCNLSGDRYRARGTRTNGKWPMVSIGSVCKLQNGLAFKPSDWETAEFGGLPIVRIQNLNNPLADFNYFSGEVESRRIIKRGDLLFSWSGSRGTSFGPHIWKGDDAILNQHIFKVEQGKEANRVFLYWMLKHAVQEVEENLHGGVGLVHITKGNLERIEIPLPPMLDQERLVIELEGYRKVIEGANQIIANYKPIINIDPTWPMVKLTNAAQIIMGQSPPGETYNQEGKGMPLINGPAEFERDQLGYSKVIQFTTQPTKLCKKGDLLVCVRGATTGRTNIASCDACIGRGVAAIRAKNQDWINHVVSALRDEIYRWGSGSTFANIKADNLAAIEIPLPSEKEQRQIMEELEAERSLVEATQELVVRIKRKMQAKLAEIWDEDAAKIANSD